MTWIVDLTAYLPYVSSIIQPYKDVLNKHFQGQIEKDLTKFQVINYFFTKDEDTNEEVVGLYICHLYFVNFSLDFKEKNSLIVFSGPEALYEDFYKIVQMIHQFYLYREAFHFPAAIFLGAFSVSRVYIDNVLRYIAASIKLPQSFNFYNMLLTAELQIESDKLLLHLTKPVQRISVFFKQILN